MRKTFFGLGLVAAVAGCHAPLVQTTAPIHTPTGSVATVSERGRVAVTIQWPYRAQVIPTSTERLRLTLSGPSSQTVVIDRPGGSAPTSTASLPVDVGTGYTLAIDALAKEFTSDFEPALLVASGQSDAFDVAANKVTSVRVVLTASFVPAITGFSPNNGGPQANVTVYGTNFSSARNIPLGFRFGGTSASVVFVSGEGTASVLVPEGATSSAIVPVADGVAGLASGSFTVLSQLGIQPLSQSVASGSDFVFTALATSSEGSPFMTPAIQWYLSTDSIGVIDQEGRFTATGTGSAEVLIYSGRLSATASVEVP